MSRPPERTVRATAPARLDFAGGWSDTPPICFDRGGTVVNAAVKLGGEYPIEATARLTGDPVITLIGREAGQRVVLDSLEQLRDSRDPGRWDALPRACLWLGLRATEPEGDLRSRLRSRRLIHLRKQTQEIVAAFDHQIGDRIRHFRDHACTTEEPVR